MSRNLRTDGPARDGAADSAPTDPDLCPESAHRPTTWRAAYDGGRKAWPEVELSFSDFAHYARALGHCSTVPPAHASDLYVASGCALFRPGAARALRSASMQRLELALGRILGRPESVEDALQSLWERLFTGTEPKIRSYRGHGPLQGWLRAIAINLAIDQLRVERSARNEQARDRRTNGELALALERERLPDALPETRQIEALEVAVKHALRSLGHPEKKLLHEHYIRGLSIDRLSPRYDVDRSTVARRIQRVLTKVQSTARRSLAGGDAPETHEVGAMFDYVRIDVDDLLDGLP